MISDERNKYCREDLTLTWLASNFYRVDLMSFRLAPNYQRDLGCIKEHPMAVWRINELLRHRLSPDANPE
jgi:hypothetical protein